MENEIKEPKKRGRPKKKNPLSEKALQHSLDALKYCRPPDEMIIKSLEHPYKEGGAVNIKKFEQKSEPSGSYLNAYPFDILAISGANKLDEFYDKIASVLSQFMSDVTSQIDRVKMSIHDVYGLIEANARRDIDSFNSSNKPHPSWNPVHETPEPVIAEPTPVIPQQQQMPTPEQFMMTLMQAMQKMQQPQASAPVHSVVAPPPSVAASTQCHGCKGNNTVQVSANARQCKNCGLMYMPNVARGR